MGARLGFDLDVSFSHISSRVQNQTPVAMLVAALMGIFNIVFL